MTVATAQLGLYNKYTTDAATFTAGSLLLLQATEAIERWYAAAQAQAARETSIIQSYSIAGRTVTYAQFEAGRTFVDQLKAEVEAILYCRGSGLMDARNSSAGGVGS